MTLPGCCGYQPTERSAVCFWKHADCGGRSCVPRPRSRRHGCFWPALPFHSLVAENPQHYGAQVNLANSLALFTRVLGDPNAPSLGRTDAAVKHLEESLHIGRRLMALDANESLIRYNHSLAAWRLGDALRARDPRTALARYDEAVAILRTMTGRPFNRDIPLAMALAESTF